MSEPQIGDRMLAVAGNGDDGTMEVFGEGIYEGRVWVDGLSELFGPNPAIRLDNGDLVYGYECWWCPADSPQATGILGQPIRYISVADFRVRRDSDG